jgi:hypothetical protein
MALVQKISVTAVACALALCAAHEGISRDRAPAPAMQAAAQAQKIRLAPHYTPGQTLRYRFDLHNKVVTHTTSPIADPEGPGRLEQSASVILRLDVLSVEGAGPDSAGHVRLRATYEKSTASSQSDTFDPQASGFEEQLRKLEGSSMEFTIEPDGQVTDFSASKDFPADPQTADVMRRGLASLSAGSTPKSKEIAVGEKWTTQQPIPTAPLAGLIWRSESSYVRNEPCALPAAVAAPASAAGGVAPAGAGSGAAGVARAGPSAASKAGNADAAEQCAVILTHLDLLQDAERGNDTPDEYVKNGLRSAGKWKGSGESVSDISLRSGLVARVTQNSSEDMDFTVTTANGESSVHYVGSIESRSEITLLP